MGVVQALKPPPSSWHWNVEPASLELKPKLALVAFVGLAGPDVIDVSGAVVSIVHVKLAGVASVFPAGSVARTWNVCEPAARAV